MSEYQDAPEVEAINEIEDWGRDAGIELSDDDWHYIGRVIEQYGVSAEEAWETIAAEDDGDQDEVLGDAIREAVAQQIDELGLFEEQPRPAPPRS